MVLYLHIPPSPPQLDNSYTALMATTSLRFNVSQPLTFALRHRLVSAACSRRARSRPLVSQPPFRIATFNLRCFWKCEKVQVVHNKNTATKTAHDIPHNQSLTCSGLLIIIFSESYRARISCLFLCLFFVFFVFFLSLFTSEALHCQI